MLPDDPSCIALAAVFGAIVGALSKGAALEAIRWLINRRLDARSPPPKPRRKKRVTKKPVKRKRRTR